MVILNILPVKAKLKDGIGSPVWLFRIPPKTNFRFETISPGVTFTGVLDQAGATALETSLAAARPQSSVTWNGPGIDMDVRIPLIQGSDSNKFYLQKPGGVWDDRYGTVTGQVTILGGNILTDYDYYIQCDYPHFPLMTFSVSSANANHVPTRPRFSGSVYQSYFSGVTMVHQNVFPQSVIDHFASATGKSAGPVLRLQDYEFVDARFRSPAGFSFYSVNSSLFNSAEFTLLQNGNINCLVAEIHDDRVGSLGSKCC